MTPIAAQGDEIFGGLGHRRRRGVERIDRGATSMFREGAKAA